ncbi:MAG: Vacuolar protein sorting-associated protein 41 [Bogoriella megaspora]|nr:MAG: Vacuolar protein sorting-associated protein 41 [Bogoriella megaspora]
MGAATDDDGGDQKATPKKSSNINNKAPETPKAGVEDIEDDDEEEEEDEPKLKYNRLTGGLGAVYRNGDATSTFSVSGDKLVIGTHNGNVHVYSLPSFQSLRVYRAHGASVTSISISPPAPSLATGRAEVAQRAIADVASPNRAPTSTSAATSSPGKSPRQAPIPNTPANAIHIGSASIDGKVCVSSLVDAKDVTLRNFARPVQAVALSPDFKNDRTYVSGGLAGNLIVTVGGRAGVSADANTNSAAAAASGWLGSIGLGSNTGKDAVLHSGEGGISTVKWSLSGKYVVWVNEKGIKIMRSHFKLESADSAFAWKRIAHIDRPARPIWEEMASVWRARVHWIDEKHLENDEVQTSVNGDSKEVEKTESIVRGRETTVAAKKKKKEQLVVGWGDTAWVLHVEGTGTGVGKSAGERSVGSASIVHKFVRSGTVLLPHADRFIRLRFDDCIVSGLSLYTPSLLLVLAYRTRDDNDKPLATTQDSPKRGRQHRQNGIPPEIRLINVHTKDIVDEDTLSVSRFESLSASDYHLNTLFVPTIQSLPPAQRGALEALGGGIWDAGRNATRIFSSGASIKSYSGSTENGKMSPSASAASVARDTAAGIRKPAEAHPFVTAPGLKVFVHSPYDCVLAVKRDEGDKLDWLLERENYKEAWELLDRHPEALSSKDSDAASEGSGAHAKSLRQQSLADFFADDSASQSTVSASKSHNPAVEKEQRRIGDLWIQQLVSAERWESAGQVAGKVLGTSSKWEHWIWTFVEAGKFDEITPHIPTATLKPPLPSMVYEVVLGHYIAKDCLRLEELLSEWDFDLFNISSITSAIESRLQAGDVNPNTTEDGIRGRDWHILMSSLQSLYLADSRPADALRCAIKLQNASEAMSLIRDYKLLSAVSDDIPGLILLRISPSQLAEAPVPELESLSSEAIALLVDEAHNGVVRPNTVVAQLEQGGEPMKPFQFFYLRALWEGSASESLLESAPVPVSTKSKPQQSRALARISKAQRREQLASEGRSLLSTTFPDLTLRVFASYSRPLLLAYLKQSSGYDMSLATSICEKQSYIPELVYLLSKTGQTRKALQTIITKLGDVKAAINFVREEGGGDEELWDDLIDFGVENPVFVKGLLEEVGTSLMVEDSSADSDAATTGTQGKTGREESLIQRIPEGVEIPGLKLALGAYLRGFELQSDISLGVARVLRTEVSERMQKLREGRARGIKFEVVQSDDIGDDWPVNPASPTSPSHPDKDVNLITPTQPLNKDEPVKPGHCPICRLPPTPSTASTLIGFACGHVYHLSCLLSTIPSHISRENIRAAEDIEARFLADAQAGVTEGRSVGAKVAHATVIRRVVEGGCRFCGGKEEEAEEW